MKNQKNSQLKKNKMEFAYTILGLFLVIILTGIFTGCTVVKTNFSDEAKKNATVYYYLPESKLKVRATVKVAVYYNPVNKRLDAPKIIEQNFTVASEIIPDTKNLLSLNYKPNILMSDDIKYGVNLNGLLETVNITTDDRSANIISELAKAPQIILVNSSLDKGSDNIKIKEYSADFEVKASSISSTPKIITWSIVVENELVQDNYETLNADFQISSNEVLQSFPTLKKLLTNNENSTSKDIKGILTRPMKNIEITIESTSNGAKKPLPINIVIPDANKLIVIPVNRTAFVKRVNKIGIKDGIIISNEITNPSSAEGFISIPINIAKAIISIPGQIVQFKFDNTKRLDELEKAKLAYEQTLLESQKFVIAKDKEIEKLKLDLLKSELNSQSDMQKLKFEIQKSLLEAETKQLEAQKALDLIKKEIETLKKVK